ncbi:hypothetical protein [Terricaulis sp.]|uniref:hypothetical protein n=1 Tax=Terricaulis sp. TaxID=2768686 RepID=UPI002AC660FC|nr:hypothetical protein [Terricaulis sp.]MDZ4690089.1 hypothetical protein [Terricaulis sp.]
MRINKIQLAGLAVVLAGVTATGANAEDVTISTATTTPLATSDPGAGAPVASGDITIASGGSITITTGQTAITVDSNNDVTNGGQISSSDASNTTGIRLQNGFAGNITNTGSISLTETYQLTDADSDGDFDGAFATGTNRHGIFLAPGTFTGNISSSGVIFVEGENSSGITLDGLLVGNFTTSASVSTIGDNSDAIRINSGVTGDVLLRGGGSARGENSSAIVVDGDIGGELVINGAWSASGFTNTTRPSNISNLDPDNLLVGGPAVAIRSNVAGVFSSTVSASKTTRMMTMTAQPNRRATRMMTPQLPLCPMVQRRPFWFRQIRRTSPLARRPQALACTCRGILVPSAFMTISTPSLCALRVSVETQ